MSACGIVQGAMGGTALIAGGSVLRRPKGTARHLMVGRLHAAAILLITGTALSIYDLTGHFDIFHAVALVNLATLAMGLIALNVAPFLAGGWLVRTRLVTAEAAA